MKVLIAEDDPLISRMYERVFTFEGFEVEMARDGQEGLDKLMKMDPLPTMILLDVMMPRKSGIDVLREIKANPKTKNIPVVVLTNLSGSQDVEKAISMGAVKFMVKSQNRPKQIVREIKEILAGYSRGAVPDIK